MVFSLIKHKVIHKSRPDSCFYDDDDDCFNPPACHRPSGSPAPAPFTCSFHGFFCSKLFKRLYLLFNFDIKNVLDELEFTDPFSTIQSRVLGVFKPLVRVGEGNHGTSIVCELFSFNDAAKIAASTPCTFTPLSTASPSYEVRDRAEENRRCRRELV